MQCQVQLRKFEDDLLGRVITNRQRPIANGYRPSSDLVPYPTYFVESLRPARGGTKCRVDFEHSYLLCIYVFGFNNTKF